MFNSAPRNPATLHPQPQAAVANLVEPDAIHLFAETSRDNGEVIVKALDISRERLAIPTAEEIEAHGTIDQPTAEEAIA